MKYLLKNGTVISGAGTRKQDVLVEGEKIIKVGKELSQPDAKVVDVSGKLLFPGFIDGHTHFDLEVAGTVTADDFETGTRAAILGGTTLVIDFASQDKGGHTLKEGLEKWHKKADGKCSCDYSFHMSIVEWNEETKKEKASILKQLESIYPKEKIVLSEKTDASLLGGYVVYVGYEEYDHSYEGKLRRLERKLTGR